MNYAIILAGGIGTRIGANLPKQFIKIQGKPILAYTLEIFQKNPNIDAIEVVCHQDWIDEVNNICKEYNISKKKWICTGGATFQDSTMKGILNLKGVIDNDDIVVISFGVSPLTQHDDINNSIMVCQKHGNGIASTNIDLCTCIKDDDYSTTQNIIRESLKGFTNPWTFKFGELCEAYETAIKFDLLKSIEPHTTSLYLTLGKKLWFSKSTSPLCKITHKQDLDLFEGYLLLQEKKKLEDEK